MQGATARALLTCWALVGCHQNEARRTALNEPVTAAAGASGVAASVATGAAGDAPASQVGLDDRAAFVSGGYREITWQFQGPFGAQPVVVVVPKSASEQRRLPVLLVFHGRGESLKAPQRGARGFIDDYGLLNALQRLEAPPLSRSDFGGWIAAQRLRSINDSLTAQPYQGLIVVCPYLPDILRAENLFSEGEQLAHFITSLVLPKVYAETPAIVGPASTAVDGVSLGGRAALAMLAYEPQAFSVVAATQPAIDQKEIDRLVTLAARARQKNSKLQLRLLSSSEDYFLQTTLDLSQALRANHVEHQLDRVLGDHSYEFNRGPGVYEMLLFADRALHSVVH